MHTYIYIYTHTYIHMHTYRHDKMMIDVPFTEKIMKKIAQVRLRTRTIHF